MTNTIRSLVSLVAASTGRMRATAAITALLVLVGLSAGPIAQSSSGGTAVNPDSGEVVRTAPAMAYGSRRGSTRIRLVGTTLLPTATGEAKVEARQGFTRIDARVANLQSPTVFGHEYLTYILWAISPDGRSSNLGELVLGRNQQGSLNVTTALQTFALVVTAEPYYAVRLPSDVVVLENMPSEDIAGSAQAVRYELIERGGYVPTGFAFDRVLLTTNLPSAFFQARNALRIAQSAGAERYVPDSYADAVRQMGVADDLASERRVNRRALEAAAREATQTAEDARAISVRRAAVERQDAERRAEADRREAATQAALAEAARRNSAETARLDRERQDAAAAVEVTRERERRDAAAAIDAARLAQSASEARQAALTAAAERDRAAAVALDQQVQQLTQEREAFRATLLAQLNAILATEDTARGLVVNMSDVTFATGQATLHPRARETLAQISGVLLAHPTLRLEIEGHTDSVGSDAANQSLSERRAGSVRSYLIQLGVAGANTSATGVGRDRPIATNETPEGRQQNRRVELVVSGDAIGTDARRD